MTLRRTRLSGIGMVIVLAMVVAACGGSEEAEDPTTTAAPATTQAPTTTEAVMEEVTLRIAMSSPGELQIAVWEAAAAAFEERNPNVTVEFNFVADEIYEGIGLQSLLNGNDAPDIYFEWAGARLENRYKEGFAADLSDFRENELSSIFEDGAFNGMVVDGKTVMVPGNADVTTVMWYNVDIFEEHSLALPETWDEMLELSKTLLEAGITPIGIGNKDLWPVGNWTSHIVSRSMGEEAYDQMLKREIPIDNPAFIEALDYIVQMEEAGIVNESASAINDNDGAELFFRGEAAMHPIGSWLVSWAIEVAPDLNFDYFNLPPLDGAGVQNSVIAVSTGQVINAQSENIDVAKDFMLLFSSLEFASMMVEAGGTPMTNGAFDRDDIDPRVLSLMQLIQNAGAVVAPPDTGYDLEVADAVYQAEAEVLAGVSTPAEAAADAEAKLG